MRDFQGLLRDVARVLTIVFGGSEVEGKERRGEYDPAARVESVERTGPRNGRRLVGIASGWPGKGIVAPSRTSVLGSVRS